MNYLKKVFKQLREFFYEHTKFKNVLIYCGISLASLASAFAFAYGFRAFISPDGVESLISGGASGVGQILVKICEILDLEFLERNQLQSLFYLIINIPLFFLAFKRIGKRFAFFSILNVVLVSVLIAYLPDEMMNIFLIKDDLLARALFAGLLTGLSTSIAVKAHHSAGGIDILSIYISSKKHSSMGKYTLILNSLIVICYTFLAGFENHATMALYTIVYFFTSSTVVDALCSRNKKTMLQITTNQEHLEKVLIHNFPHGCTVVDAKGGYTGSPRKIIYTVVSAFEVKKAVKVIQEIDPNAFITIMNTSHVYGKFFIKPLK